MEHFDERKNNPTSVIADGRKQSLYNRTKQPQNVCLTMKTQIGWSDIVLKISSLASAAYSHGHFSPIFQRKHNDFTASTLRKEVCAWSTTAWSPSL